MAPGIIFAPPVRAATDPRHASANSGVAGTAVRRLDGGTKAVPISGMPAPNMKLAANASAVGSRAGFQGRRDAEFVTRMRAESVVSHELVGYLLCELGIEAAPNVDCRQLLVLASVVGSEFGAFEREVSLLGVLLRRHRHILARSIRHRAGN
jgi:hypothetical protein